MADTCSPRCALRLRRGRTPPNSLRGSRALALVYGQLLSFTWPSFCRCYKGQASVLQRTGSMYSTHSDFTRTTRTRVGSVYLQVPSARNGGGGGGGGNRLQRTPSGYSSQTVGSHKDRASPNRLVPPSSPMGPMGMGPLHAANGNGFDGHD